MKSPIDHRKPIRHKKRTCESCGKFTVNLKWGMCQSCRPHMGATDVWIRGNRKSLRMLAGMVVDVNSSRDPMVRMFPVGDVA